MKTGAATKRSRQRAARQVPRERGRVPRAQVCEKQAYRFAVNYS